MNKLWRTCKNNAALTTYYNYTHNVYNYKYDQPSSAIIILCILYHIWNTTFLPRDVDWSNGYKRNYVSILSSCYRAGGPDCGDGHDLICRNIGTQGLGLTTEKKHMYRRYKLIMCICTRVTKPKVSTLSAAITWIPCSNSTILWFLKA